MGKGIVLVGMPGRFHVATRLAVIMLVAVSAQACVGSSTAPFAGDASLTAGASPSLVLASTSPGQSAPSATFTPGPIPSVGTAPAGAWTGIHWIAGPDVSVQETASPEPAAGADDVFAQFRMFGWSRGYVAFRATSTTPTSGGPVLVTLVPSFSTDGLSWQTGAISNLAGPAEPASVGDVVEGPAGLLAIGSPAAAICGGPAPVTALWLSSDGISWRPVAMTPFGGGAVYDIEAGSAGYIATGTAKDGANQRLWTSRDGVAWSVVNVATATAKGVNVSNATAFSGGFVMAGNMEAVDPGCGEPSVTPSLWWSPNGKTWTRAALPGAISASSAIVRVSRIDDRLLMAQESSYDETTSTGSQTVWTSADGRTWKLNSNELLATSVVVDGGQRGLLTSTASDGSWRMSIWAVNDDLSLVQLKVTGAPPTEALGNGSGPVLGPTGLVVSDMDGTRFWIGVPTAG